MRSPAPIYPLRCSMSEINRSFQQEVQRSLGACAEIARNSRSSFFPSFRLLPLEKRRAMKVVYAFMRYTDDLIDLHPEESIEKKADFLDRWESAVHWALDSVLDGAEREGPGFPPKSPDEEPQGPPPEYPAFRELQDAYPDLQGIGILPALRFIVDQYDIPKAVFSEVLYGVRTDIQPTRYAEFEDCADYFHAVATSVGVASLAIWGTKKPLFSPEIVKQTKACGIAIQLTNVLRDLVEDLRNERFYLPQSELQLYGLTERQILSLSEYHQSGTKHSSNSSHNDRFAEKEFFSQVDSFYRKFDRFIGKQLDRIETHYLMAADLYQEVNRDSRRSFGMIWDAYYRLFKNIRKNPRAILVRRVKLGFYQKLRLALRWKFFPPRTLG